MYSSLHPFPVLLLFNPRSTFSLYMLKGGSYYLTSGSSYFHKIEQLFKIKNSSIVVIKKTVFIVSIQFTRSLPTNRHCCSWTSKVLVSTSAEAKRCFVRRLRGRREIDRAGTRGECKSMSCWELSAVSPGTDPESCYDWSDINKKEGEMRTAYQGDTDLNLRHWS